MQALQFEWKQNQENCDLYFDSKTGGYNNVLCSADFDKTGRGSGNLIVI